MTKMIQKIEKQISTLEGKIEVPGGNLVAVCSNNIQWKSTRKYKQFRDWLAEHTHSITESKATFEMTGVNTVVLVMDKVA